MPLTGGKDKVIISSSLQLKLSNANMKADSDSTIHLLIDILTVPKTSSANSSELNFESIGSKFSWKPKLL